jgi:hypothetical protein
MSEEYKIICSLQLVCTQLVFIDSVHTFITQNRPFVIPAMNEGLLSYNLTNTVTLRTTVTKNTNSLIDVMIINKQYNKNSTEVVNLGYSDHFAQILFFFFGEQTV